ncbi:hypothetical protein ETAA8_36220 [Anatilimnocola aggregata]|uniref:Uncharacterized protein n=1 Tax=Anatilimnocola aggregata TaxID=2528021 RepID=A0A517YE74_9BACT|nr:hypothetical protein [Anatilimnocola aggregata]QDU28520.1 hypothetical protein ETAA8_36220 [Anatilimnocola aggregata]
MDSSELTLEQIEVLLEQELASLGRYAQLAKRMRERGFPGDDELVRFVERARAASQDLRMWLHYRYGELKYRQSSLKMCPPAVNPSSGEPTE